MHNVFQGQGPGADFTASTIAAAVNDTASANKAIFLPPNPAGSWTISADVTVPANRRLLIPAGTTLSINSGITLTLRAPYRCEHNPCFTGAGTVVGFDEHGQRNVLHFGATAAGVSVDDTAAIQRTLRGIPGDGSTYFSAKGAGCVFFPLPATVDGFYKVSDTLDVSEKWNICLHAPARYAYNRQATDPARQALIKWYGAPNTPVFLFHYAFGVNVTNISVDCRATAGTVGFALGATGAIASSVKNFVGMALDAAYCDIGMRIGDNANGGPDLSSIDLHAVHLHDNASAGLSINSGNAVVNAYGLTAISNGAAPINGRPGANVEHQGGQLYLYGYIGAGGQENTPVPVGADVFSGAGGVQIYGAWSDTYGLFLDVAGGSTQTAVVTGVRHYAQGMTDGNTPKSIRWASTNSLNVSGFFFSNIEVNAGQNSLVNDQGVVFYVGPQHTTVTPGFTGTAIANQYAYVGMPRGEQHGILAVGKPPRKDIGEDAFHRPYFSIIAPNLASGAAYCTDDPNGNGCVATGYHYPLAQYDVLGNAYRTSAGAFKSIQAGRMSYFSVSGGDPALGQPHLSFMVDNATGPGETTFTPGTMVFQVAYLPIGTGSDPVAVIGTRQVAWAAAAPTSGTWGQGSIVYNNAAAAGQPIGWQCTAGGSPGTWRALPVLP